MSIEDRPFTISLSRGAGTPGMVRWCKDENECGRVDVGVLPRVLRSDFVDTSPQSSFPSSTLLRRSLRPLKNFRWLRVKPSFCNFVVAQSLREMYTMINTKDLQINATLRYTKIAVCGSFFGTPTNCRKLPPVQGPPRTPPGDLSFFHFFRRSLLFP
jgi:hypothetical protein